MPTEPENSQQRILELAAGLRRVKTPEGSAKFHKAIGDIIVSGDSLSEQQRQTTLITLLSLYKNMLTAKKLGNKVKFQSAMGSMNQAIAQFEKTNPGNAGGQIRKLVSQLSFSK